MNEIITINEVMNDGKCIHLYYNGLIGLYTAYGYSAFILSKLTNVKAAFSENMQMPVVVINTTHLSEVIKDLKVVKQEKGYYLLSAENLIDEKEYYGWVREIRFGEANS